MKIHLTTKQWTRSKARLPRHIAIAKAKKKTKLKAVTK